MKGRFGSLGEKEKKERKEKLISYRKSSGEKDVPPIAQNFAIAVAQRIYDDARPLIETQLAKVQREGR